MWIKVQMWIEDEGLAPYLMSIKLNEATKNKRRSFWSQNAATDWWHMTAK